MVITDNNMWGEVIVCTRMGIFVPTIGLLIGSAAQRDNEPDLPKPSMSPPQNNTHCEIVSLVYCPTTMDITSVRYDGVNR